MTFLQSSPDLRGTLFSPTDLALARLYLGELIGWEDPAWLQNPTGYLAQYWQSDDPAATCFLIDLAKLLNGLELGGVSPESRPVLFKKLHALLRKIRQPEAFAEALTELQVAGWLSRQDRPVLLEPRILELATDQPPRLAPLIGSKLIDLALPVAGQILFVEVTVLNFEAFDRWCAIVSRLARLIADNLWLEEWPYRVRLTLPFPAPAEFDHLLINRPPVSTILNQLALVSEKTGQLDINFNSTQPVKLAWTTEPAWPDPAPFLISQSQGVVEIGLTNDHQRELEESLIKSLRNSLKIKHAQCLPETSPLLVVRPGNPLLPPALLLDLVERRLWSNPRYRWLSALAVFAPRSGYTPADPPLFFRLSPNRQAYRPLSDPIIAQLRADYDTLPVL